MIHEVIYSFFGVLLLYSACSKFAAFRLFRGQLDAAAIIPAGIRLPVTVAVVGFEIAVGIALLSPHRHRLAPAALITLLACFTAYVFIALRRRRSTACFCFGEDDGLISRFTLLRNSLLLMGAMLGVADDALHLTPAVSFPARVLLRIYGATAVAWFLTYLKLRTIEQRAGDFI